jgi:hypothetical protein
LGAARLQESFHVIRSRGGTDTHTKERINVQPLGPDFRKAARKE